eukprot:6370834-Prymnesium_polylepis.1
MRHAVHPFSHSQPGSRTSGTPCVQAHRTYPRQAPSPGMPQTSLGAIENHHDAVTAPSSSISQITMSAWPRTLMVAISRPKPSPSDSSGC